ncbi:MAG: RNA polymerase sigma factor [Cytophagales bacterium]|nr:RNA polymerase sigma factor [Cytophagales bacterium]MCE2958537.1 RNA polymerase sigma factor [Flammeovirgaceae bacterium]
MQSETDLIAGCVEGNRASQKALYDRYCRKMMVICQRYAKTTAEAEDILQEGFLKIFGAIKSFRGDAALTTWMTRIMINTALNSQRQKLYMLPMVDISEVQLPEREEISLASFHLQELIAMVQSLPDGCRIVFNLFAIEGYGHKEIADMLNISEGTSKSQYNRAKNLLKEKLEAQQKRYEFGKSKV